MSSTLCAPDPDLSELEGLWLVANMTEIKSYIRCVRRLPLLGEHTPISHGFGERGRGRRND